MKKINLSVMILTLASVFTTVNVNAGQNKNPVLSHLSEMAHAITDNTVVLCQAHLSKDLTGKNKDEAVKACQVDGIRALTSFSICAVYNNTDNLSDAKTDSCYEEVKGKYIKY